MRHQRRNTLWYQTIAYGYTGAITRNHVKLFLPPHGFTIDTQQMSEIWSADMLAA